MDQTQTPLIDAYWNLDDDPISDELFEGPWPTPTLAAQFALTLSPYSDNPKVVQFWDEYRSDDWGGWVRGNLCRALAAEGVTLHTINRRKS